MSAARDDSADAPSGRSAIRRAFEALLADAVAQSSLGYAVSAVSFGQTIDVTLDKDGAAFAFWLRPIGDAVPHYRATARFSIGYPNDPPDRLGFKLLDAVCARIEAWERGRADVVCADLFEAAPPPAAPSVAPVDIVAGRLLGNATFAPLHRDWLPERQRRLAGHLESRRVGDANVLLVNATKGLPFFASIVDFFALAERTHGRIRVTSASYFDDIFQFHEEVAAKGLQVVSIAAVMAWDVAEINRFDVVLLIGPSQVMARLMALPGITARLVLLDLGFYHQLLDSYPGWSPSGSASQPSRSIFDTDRQINRVVAYSCQPEEKVVWNLRGVCALPLLTWRWVNYIPIGFTYSTYYRSDTRRFDVALLGSNERDYAQIDPDLFHGLRFLFLGVPDRVPEILRLRERVDMTVVERVDEDTYARLLAVCRCVVMPAQSRARSALLSLIDTVASGKPLVTSRHIGIARLERDEIPAVFYDATASDLFRQVDQLLSDPDRIADIERRSIAFAREKLDIYRILETIFDEQVEVGSV